SLEATHSRPLASKLIWMGLARRGSAAKRLTSKPSATLKLLRSISGAGSGTLAPACPGAGAAGISRKMAPRRVGGRQRRVEDIGGISYRGGKFSTCRLVLVETARWDPAVGVRRERNRQVTNLPPRW